MKQDRSEEGDPAIGSDQGWRLGPSNEREAQLNKEIGLRPFTEAFLNQGAEKFETLDDV